MVAVRADPSATLQAHKFFRDDNERFLPAEDVIDGGNAASVPSATIVFRSFSQSMLGNLFSCFLKTEGHSD